MDSLGNPQNNRIPYIDVTGKDCTQGICSLYCPQWCYPAFPPPPPPIQFLGDDTSSPGPNLSPLLIAVIGVLAGAFLLVTYYTVISKFCQSSDPSGTEQAHGVNPSADGDPSPGPDHEAWYVSTGGLDEALIRSITVCKYKRGSGMIEGTCSVCLSEFQDGESVRLLPNCTHAFHIICIDTWLMSHSNCPLCRSEVAPTGSFPVMIPLLSDAPLPESYGDSDNQIDPGTGSASPRSSSSGVPHRGEATGNGNLAVKSRSVRISCDACNIGRTDTVIEVHHEELQAIRRSFSTGHLCQTVADILKADQINEEDQTRGPTGSSTNHGAGSVKNYSGVCKIGHSRNFPHGVIDWPVPMKRSSTSGRLSHSRHERAKGVSIRFPVRELPV